MKIVFSVHAHDVMTSRAILESWVEQTVLNSSRKIVVSEDEVHYFTTIQEYDGRCLKVVFNPKKNLVITTFFDRKMKIKGC